METLFHYTTAAGLLGILKNGNIWASDLRFLNDAQESVYARDMIIDAIEKNGEPCTKIRPLGTRAWPGGE